MKRLAVWLFFCVVTNATTVIPMSVERLTESSSDVVLARAEESWTEWNSAHTLLHTITRFHVARAIKGRTSETLLVRQLGGRADGIEQKVSGVRMWRRGEEAVLFLRPSREQAGNYAVTGLFQGDFRLIHEGRETYVSNGVPGVEEGTGRRFTGARMQLHELESRVRAAALHHVGASR